MLVVPAKVGNTVFFIYFGYVYLLVKKVGIRFRCSTDSNSGERVHVQIASCVFYSTYFIWIAALFFPCKHIYYARFRSYTV